MVLPDQIKEAVRILSDGGVVAFPTETVYGLGADASNPSAVELLYKLKGRPSTHPSIVHLSSVEQIDQWCVDFPPSAEVLANLFWPGPLTMILKKAPDVSLAVTGGQDTIGIRIPAHPVAQQLLRQFGKGIAAPSANRFGRLSPTAAEDVRSEFGQEVMVLDGGVCQVGIESTIIDLSSGSPRILRPGMILEESINVALGEFGHPQGTGGSTPRVPGSLPSHYAPDKPVKLLTTAELESELKKDPAKRCAFLSFKPAPANHERWQVMPASPEMYAFMLYRSLRRLDNSDAELILVERPPPEPQWAGIIDRLTRAAGESHGGDCV
jgi:L-threonylcarbamoyladenylate synthase